VFNKIHELNGNTGKEDDNSILMKVNKLDNLITSIMLKSEKSNCKKKDNNTLWTPQIKQSDLRVQYWNIKLKTTRQRIVSNKRIKDILMKMDEDSFKIIKSNTKSLSGALKTALQDHSKLCKANTVDRSEYLETIMKDLKERNHGCHVSVKQLIQQEQSRYDYKVIRNVLKPMQSKGIKYLDVFRNGKDGTIDRITNQEIIEEKIFERNKTHFGQAKNTPFAKTELGKVFGYEGVNKNAETLVYKGIIPEYDQAQYEYVNKFLEKLRNGKVIKIDDNISFEEYKNALIKWNEKTTASPSGRHLGHYKILLKLNIFEDTSKRINISQIILHALYKINMIAIKMGKPIQRWMEIATCMIEKVPGVSRLDKLRVIHIFEVDYNN
jgi:hypothetical protein